MGGTQAVEHSPDTWLTLSWPPTSQTVKLMFLYSTVSTLKPAGRPAHHRVSGCAMQQQVNNYPAARRRTNGGDGGHNLSQLELVEDGCLTSSIQANLQQEQASAPSPGLPDSCPQPSGAVPWPNRTIRILISFLAMSRLSSLEMVRPMAAAAGTREKG